MRARTWLWSLACGLCSISASAALDLPAAGRTQRVSDAITEGDLVRATELLEQADSESQALSFERARLAVYLGECDRAMAILSSPALLESREGAALAELAKGCAGATAAGLVVEDKTLGISLRLQDDADRPLAPFIFTVAARARDTISKEIGTDLPRPLRIELVRDLFSLSAITGLPLAAAETTGTLAVARWGRVTMLSPRALTSGYPWQDTLAHEITHLLVTRASRDFAPLWLQEGLAKRFETRWREPRPFDKADWADGAARSAAQNGRSIGIDKLGPSIAMLPTPEAAATAFAEVTSFVRYWIEQNGEAALHLLLMDLRGNGPAGADAALRSVSARDLAEWNTSWQRALLQSPAAPAPAPAPARSAQKRPPKTPAEARDTARRWRLSELLFARGLPKQSVAEIEPTLSTDPRDPVLRFRAARGYLAMGDATNGERVLSSQTEIDAPYGPWFALLGRFAAARGDTVQAAQAFELGVALEPLTIDVACEGYPMPISASADDLRLPKRQEWRDLCLAARKMPSD